MNKISPGHDMVKERAFPYGTHQDAYSNLLHILRYQKAGEYVSKNTGMILDIACGFGYGSSIWNVPGRYVGLDIDDSAVRFANEHFGRYGVFQKYDGKEIPYEDGSFDVVCSIETIEHLDVEAHKAFYMELCRVLSPGGILIMSTPNRNYWWKKIKQRFGWENRYHKYEYETHEFLRFVEQNAAIEDVFCFGFPLKLLTNRPMRSILPQKWDEKLGMVEIKLGGILPRYCDSIFVVLNKR